MEPQAVSKTAKPQKKKKKKRAKTLRLRNRTSKPHAKANAVSEPKVWEWPPSLCLCVEFFILYAVQYALYILYAVQYVLYTVCCTVRSIYCMLYSVYNTGPRSPWEWPPSLCLCVDRSKHHLKMSIVASSLNDVETHMHKPCA